MSVIRLTKEFSFEASHLLEGYDGACSQIHGHSYRLFVTVKGRPNTDTSDPKFGMVMDFGALKKIVKNLIIDKYDHSLVVRRTESNMQFIESLKQRFDRIVETDYQPTCENMLPRFAGELKKALPQGVSLFSLRLHETATSFAEWFEEDNP
ncbi:MAG: 6-carboxytetrahydropterin synthase [Rikenellaceae bacterium]|nr:6-carboxytetrahydropterin synthase [Rikenellaceae bacterium]